LMEEAGKGRGIEEKVERERRGGRGGRSRY
jgi:hypothetical protein